MIVRDEENCLEECLSSVCGAVDEIVILDTGSNDGTKEIAARYTDRVYDYPWNDDFAAARNASFACATKPFLLWLDADDVIDAPQLEKLIDLKHRLSERIDAVMMPYHYAFSENGQPSLVFDRERIVRRAAGFLFSGAVHEAMAVQGHVIREDIVIRHTGRHGQSSCARNLRIYRRGLDEGRRMTPRDWYYYARELKTAGEYAQAEQAYRAFLGMNGWQENRLDALLGLGECLKQLGRMEEARAAYILAATTGVPRAEALCALALFLLEAGDLRSSAYWYRAALLCEKPESSGAFVQPDAYSYIPLMQLCVIYDRLGDTQRASQMNEQALLHRPGDAAALCNRAYFAEKLQKMRREQEKRNREA